MMHTITVSSVFSYNALGYACLCVCSFISSVAKDQRHKDKAEGDILWFLALKSLLVFPGWYSSAEDYSSSLSDDLLL
jgi:hypothetical protein